MRMLRFFATRAGVVLTVVMLLAGASVAYAMIRSTTELAGQLCSRGSDLRTVHCG